MVLIAALGCEDAPVQGGALDDAAPVDAAAVDATGSDGRVRSDLGVEPTDARPDPARDTGSPSDLGVRDAEADQTVDGPPIVPDAEPMLDAHALTPDGAAPVPDGGPAVSDGALDSDQPRFDEARFAASHNSYSGETRRSIVAQLEEGVRVLELDLHDDDYEAIGDYRIGHLWPGNEVSDEDGNPETDLLGPWLEHVRSWSSAHADHGPITLVLDLKDSLTDNRGPEHGNLGALNARLETALGDQLVAAADVDTPWPPVDVLRGRILTVLSGDRGSRAAYARDHGMSPAVATNVHGEVIEVHDSGRGELWFWTGRLRPEGVVDWRHHGRYAAGRRPAVLLTDEGVIIAVHQGAVLARLFATVGHLDDDGTVRWEAPVEYDTGVEPTLGLRADGSIEEIHRSELTGQRWRWTLEWVDGALRFFEHGRTDRALYPVDRSGQVRVFTAADALGTPDTLQYATDAIDLARIRYRPLAFVEAQPGDPEAITAAARFRAAPAGLEDFVRRPGVVARWWGVTEAHADGAYLPQAPATDTPFAPWYRALMADSVR